MTPIKHPKLKGTKNRDLWEYTEQQETVLKLYQIRQKKIREGMEENQEED